MFCNIHNLDFEQKEVEMFGKAILFGICPKCQFESERILLEKEKEQSAREFIGRMENRNIEPLYYSVTLDGFDTSTSELERAKEAVSEIITSKTGKLVMLGKNGTGKTHLAVCAVKALGGKILTMYEISTRIRATYTQRAKEDETDVTGELARLPMLVIDEIGRTKGSEAEENWLSYIIDKRTSRGLPLILISNKHSRKTCAEKGCKDCIENYLSEDVMSRLNLDGKMLHFTGDDYRKQQRVK